MPDATPLVGLLDVALAEAVAQLTGEVARNHPDLRAAHLRLFRTGSVEGRRVTELAARARMTKQSMHALVAHLERHGYLRGERDPEDVRARRITLTDRGRGLAAEVAAAAARADERWRDQLGTELYEALGTALRKIGEH